MARMRGSLIAMRITRARIAMKTLAVGQLLVVFYRPPETAPLGEIHNVSHCRLVGQTEDLGSNTSRVKMKRYGNLYPMIYDRANILAAHQNARKGKRFYREVIMVDKNPEKYVNAIHGMLKNKTFRNATYEIFTRVECGKSREIAKVAYYPDSNRRRYENHRNQENGVRYEL